MIDSTSRTSSRRRWQPVAWAAAAALLVATLGGLATDIGPWYRSLQQPAWKPPDAWFGPAWTTIYALTAARDRSARSPLWSFEPKDSRRNQPDGGLSLRAKFKRGKAAVLLS